MLNVKSDLPHACILIIGPETEIDMQSSDSS